VDLTVGREKEFYAPGNLHFRQECVEKVSKSHLLMTYHGTSTVHCTNTSTAPVLTLSWYNVVTRLPLMSPLTGRDWDGGAQ
jgi:hypothetical protein